MCLAFHRPGRKRAGLLTRLLVMAFLGAMAFPNAQDSGPSGSGQVEISLTSAAIESAGEPEQGRLDSGSSQGTVAADTDTAEYLELREMRFRGKRTKLHTQKEASRQILDRDALQKMAATQGDPLRAVGMLPGVTRQNDISVRPFVRGGKSEETRVFLDGIPLLQPYHFASIYSIFNMESLDRLVFYSGGFPVQGSNALSGALFMDSRPAPLDSGSGMVELSMLRGNGYIGLPLIEGKLGAYAAYHALWYDWVINRGLDLISWASDDSGFTASKERFQRYVDLPNFRDLQFGLSFSPAEDALLNYTGLLSRDLYTTLGDKRRYYVGGKEVSPTYLDWHTVWGSPEVPEDSRVVRDTLAIVAVPNQSHLLHGEWQPDPYWSLKSTQAYQRQDWDVIFYDDEIWQNDGKDSLGRFTGRRARGTSSLVFEHARNAWSSLGSVAYHGFEGHMLTVGAGYDIWHQRYDTQLPRPIYEAVINGSSDVVEGLGYYESRGFTIRETEDLDNIFSQIDFASELPSRIRFEYDGSHVSHFASVFISDSWRIDELRRLNAGVRLEYESQSGELFPSPRVSWFQSAGEADQLTLSAGLYSQNDIPFYMRHDNPELASEKAFHINGEWSHYFSESFRLEWQNYHKHYFDLVAPQLTSTGRIDWANSQLQIDSAEFHDLPDAAQAMIRPYLEDKVFRYYNTGRGAAMGSELSFFYDPNKVWHGWISGEMSYSKRQDRPGERWYDYRYHRPWSVNWINYFRMPSRYELAVRLKWAAGQPYTRIFSKYGSEFFETTREEGAVDSSIVFQVGPRNGKRYAPYQRLDLRLSKNSTLFGRPFQSYMEIWNAFNSPNLFLRDSETGYLKFFDLNYPVPILFFGFSYRW